MMMKARMPRIASTPTATPTPIPALAPLERPLEVEAAAVEVAGAEVVLVVEVEDVLLELVEVWSLQRREMPNALIPSPSIMVNC